MVPGALWGRQQDDLNSQDLRGSDESVLALRLQCHPRWFAPQRVAPHEGTKQGGPLYSSAATAQVNAPPVYVQEAFLEPILAVT